MAFVLQRIPDGAFAAPLGNLHSYVKYIEHARGFDTLEQAKAEQCGNERVCRIVYDGALRLEAVPL